MKKLFAIGLCLVMAGCASMSQTPQEAALVKQLEASQPPLPKGLSWTAYQGLAVPMPDSWYKRKDPKDLSLSASAERPAGDGSFKTGVTIKTYISAAALMSVKVGESVDQMEILPASPTVSVYGVIQKIRAMPGVTMLTEPVPDFQNGREFYNFTYMISADGKEPIQVRHILIANDQDQTLRSVKFQSLVSMWDARWREEGSKIFSRIAMVRFH